MRPCLWDLRLYIKTESERSFNAKTPYSQCDNPIVKIRRSREHLLYSGNPYTWRHGFVYWICSLNPCGRVMHTCVSKLTNIGSDNGLSFGRRQVIIWTNAVVLLVGPQEKNQWIFNRHSHILIQENAFENVLVIPMWYSSHQNITCKDALQVEKLGINMCGNWISLGLYLVVTSFKLTLITDGL